MSNDETEVQTAQVNTIMDQLRPQLLEVAAGGVITSELIKNVQDIVIKNHGVAGALLVGGLRVLIPALTIAIVNVVGFTVRGVAAGSLAAAMQSASYGALTSGVFSALQCIGATAVIAPPVVLAVAGAAVLAGGGYLAYKELEKHSIIESTAQFADRVVTSNQIKMIATEAHKHLRAAGDGAGAFFGAVGTHVGFAANSTAQFAEHVVRSEQIKMIATEANNHLRAAGAGAGAFFGAAGEHAANAASSTATFFGGLGRAFGK